jgi:hypothetical protein
MTGHELIKLFQQGTKRYHLIGTVENGVVAGLDLEGRLFTIIDGEVVSRVNPEAISGVTTRTGYLNPGGDGLWPAPEGTCYGYEYTAGTWRVPPGLTGAKYIVVENNQNHALIEAEVDLINASGLGIATIFRREISVNKTTESMAVKVIESIEYIGTQKLSREQCLLTPWSLSQFDCCTGCEVIFPKIDASEVWDMYDPSDNRRFVKDDFWHTETDGGARYQIGLGAKVPWIELQLPAKNLKVRRTAKPLVSGQDYIDIIDAPPTDLPSAKGVRYSVYTDTDGFMEVEAAGGCPETFETGTIMSVEILTEYFNALMSKFL